MSDPLQPPLNGQLDGGDHRAGIPRRAEPLNFLSPLSRQLHG